jgi:hypothetical protein
VYPVLSLEQASDYQSIASNVRTANRLERVWLVVFDVPPQISSQIQGAGDVLEWNRFGRTLLLPPPEDATIIQSLVTHLEHLGTLPHTPVTLLQYHLTVAQLAGIQGLTVRAQQEWQAAQQLHLEIPEAAGPDDYTAFIHLRDSEGNVVFQDDFTPSPSTRGWWPGDAVWQVRDVRIPAHVKVGEYRVYTGMYRLSTMERLSVRPAGPSGDNSVYLTTLRVTG